jgi:hypothetical protein
MRPVKPDQPSSEYRERHGSDGQRDAEQIVRRYYKAQGEPCL